MLTVLMECRDQETELAQTLSVLVAGAVEGLVSDVGVLDFGSRDASSRVADAAGCRFHLNWNLTEVLSAARGEWVMLVEAGARPQSGWIDEVAEHISVNSKPARFSPSRNYRQPFYRRIGRASPPLENGLILAKRDALASSASGKGLADLAQGRKPFQLVSEIVPAWAARS
jgi:hypothetical protein